VSSTLCDKIHKLASLKKTRGIPMSKLGEYILRKFSRDPNAMDYVNEHYEQKHRDVKVYIQSLKNTFPDIETKIINKNVLDIGCAEGLETLAISMMGANEVHGIDIRINEDVNRQIQQQYPNNRMKFTIMDATNTQFKDSELDAVVTCGSFEHFNDPYLILKESKRILVDNGLIFLTSGVWAHPWGAHMNFFTRVPWVQFIFCESTIMNVRRAYRNDGATIVMRR
jgi:ubiquinone/menaquinone biosynthesis C-methylase UbiE